MAVDQSTVAQIAAQANIPPSVLFGVTQLSGFGSKVDDATQLQQVAQQLTDAFAKNGSWEAALAELISGDPSAAQSPTSPVGGMVAQVMGIAAARPTWGVTGAWQPASQAAFKQRALAFGKSIQTLSQLGGVVTPDHTKQWYQTAATVRRGPGASGSYAQTSGRGTGPSPLQFAAAPFDAKFNTAVTEEFGDTSGPGGYAEQGNDFGLPHGTAVNAPVTGTVKVVRPANPNSGTGLTLYIQTPDVRGPDGKMAKGPQVYIGHLGDTGLQDGQQVQAGQPVGTSGGVPGVDQYPGNSTGAHVEIGIIGADGKLYDPGPAVRAAAQQGGSGAPRTGGQVSSPAAAPQGRDVGHQQSTPSPQAVANFAQQAKSMGLTPEHFMQLYPHLSATRRRLLGLNTDLSDVAPHVGQTPDQVVAAVRATPHPVYPELTAGQVMDSLNTASLWSFQYTQKPPSLAEAARMASAGMKHQDIATYYKSQVQQAPSLPGVGSSPSLRVMSGGGDQSQGKDQGDGSDGEPKRKQGGPQ